MCNNNARAGSLAAKYFWRISIPVAFIIEGVAQHVSIVRLSGAYMRCAHARALVPWLLVGFVHPRALALACVRACNAPVPELLILAYILSCLRLGRATTWRFVLGFVGQVCARSGCCCWHALRGGALTCVCGGVRRWLSG